jgi:ferredoxin
VTPEFSSIEAALAPHGLIMRGGFHPGPDDNVPGETLVMVGNAGPDMWSTFEAVRGDYAGRDNPLDGWISDVCGATPLFPFGGPPHLPFQRWAQRAEPVYPSPVGVLIHPDFGLWHAYRGALAFTEKLPLPQTDTRPAPCETCLDKPCLSACPVDAFAGGTYDVPACVGHITDGDDADCMPRGCAARRACPVGQEYIYAPAQAEFHMRAFVGAQAGD